MGIIIAIGVIVVAIALVVLAAEGIMKFLHWLDEKLG